MLTVGSLCTGTAALERSLRLLGVDFGLSFVADPDPAATALLAHHHPDVPNLDDITAVDWTRVPGVDCLLAGYPCQGFSFAGRRLGEHDDRFIWPHVFHAVRDLRPRVVVLENVPGHLSLGFGRVLGDLASIGYDANWTCVRASDVGAAHRRDRVFILAFPAGTDPREVLGVPAAGAAFGRGGDGAVLMPTPRASDTGTPGRRCSPGFRPPLSQVVLPLLPTPRTSDTNGAGGHGAGGLDLRTAVTLLPTPRASDGEKGGPNQRGSKGDLTLNSAVHLLPTPTVGDARNSRNATAGRTRDGAHNDGWTLSDVAYADRWGQFAPAIARWEAVIGRPAPEPTEPGRDGGNPRLSPRFVEWLMGHPDGWVTDLILPKTDPRPNRISRNQALRLLGNGVVSLQGAEAVRQLLAAT